MYLISDNVDTQVGMRLAGVEGVVVHEAREVREAVNRALEDKEISILLITVKLTGLVPDLITDIKLNRRTPLVVEIPDRHGLGRPADFITSYVREAIGLKI